MALLLSVGTAQQQLHYGKRERTFPFFFARKFFTGRAVFVGVQCAVVLVLLCAVVFVIAPRRCYRRCPFLWSLGVWLYLWSWL